MGKYLVTGHGGSGKSTVCTLLLAYGLNAFDSDENSNLAQAEDLQGRTITVDWRGFVGHSKVAFNWQPSVLTDFLAKHHNVFLCGGASNKFEYYSLFDRVFFVLTLGRTTHKIRLKRENEYGKDPRTMAYLLDKQPQFAERAIRHGAETMELVLR